MLDCQKHHFALPPDLHYLNCAYLSPNPIEVEEAGRRAIERGRDPSSVTPSDFFEESDRLRAAFARLIGIPCGDNIAVVPSVSYGVATAARNVDLGPGRNVVVLHEQFPSNLYAWRTACLDSGATLHTVRPPDPGPGRGAAWNERILDAIDEHTSVVALPHVHWTDGTRFDLERIGARARDVGAALVVDGTQSIGALPFDARAIRPDAVLCAGYKWLFGPYGLGLAYFGERFTDGRPIEENWITRRNSEDFSGLVDYEDDFQPGAVRFDVGQRSSFLLVPMLLRAIELVEAWTPEAIQTYCEWLTRPLFDELGGLGYRVEDPAWRGAHLFGIRLPDSLPIADVRNELQRRRIHVSVRGSAIRVGPNVYNDADDIGALAEALRTLAHASTVRTA